MNTRSLSKPGDVFGAAEAFLKARPVISAALLSIVLCCFVGLRYSSGSDEGQAGVALDVRNTTIGDAAIENFWAVYHGNDYDDIPEVEDQLERALRLDPNNSHAVRATGAPLTFGMLVSTRAIRTRTRTCCARICLLRLASSKRLSFSITTASISSDTSTTIICPGTGE